MGKPQLKREDLKIIYYHLPTQNAQEDPKGCSVVHRIHGFGAVSEVQHDSARENLLQAVGAIASKLGLPVEQSAALFRCPTCQHEHLPKATGWTEDHTYQYKKEVEVKVGDETHTLHCYITRDHNEPKWSWSTTEEAYSDQAISYGEEFFIEDALAAADAAAATWVNDKQVGDDESGASK